ncbi:FAD-dependent oxidoreductase [Phyllobacterium myrsinacearum]|uniref:Flavin-dependent monooxygenase n=1 Tax=Phyllobacterium myrsinacearum TaxID=28101 RepID=A0A839EE77_9HYPH|nr:NAD(P)/FAD-dependent oxidoreductase [Phyllobacterium myrsinacearum]MBA8876718.1 2-polyprenyl-6-methoxyphenol hydroxylase-like FAD-dependent oxidoreductase [Phyllobacterium myrsinacearum]
MSKNTGIAIVGGGPSGLLLARMLYLKGVPFTVFERDESPLHRPQGGMLDLHPETGQYAMKRAGLFAEFQKFARYEDQGMRLYDKHGTLVYGNDASEGDRPEIDRSQLRDLLVQSIPQDAIRWGHRLSQAVQLEDGATELRFENGAVEQFDFVVGADGAWSKVRPLVSDIRPGHMGLTMYELSIDDADTRHPEVAALVGRGTAVAKGDGRSIFAQRNANAHIRVYAALPRQEEAFLVETKASLLAHFADWDNKLLQLLHAGEDDVRPWPIYALPVGHSWENRAGVTLIGDAAHLMPPAGEGANLALRDAADLADALTGNGDQASAVRAYEAAMFVRAKVSAGQAMEAFAAGSAEDSLEVVRKRVSGEL